MEKHKPFNLTTESDLKIAFDFSLRHLTNPEYVKVVKTFQRDTDEQDKRHNFQIAHSYRICASKGIVMGQATRNIPFHEFVE
ncbi:MAG TPA: hypothetical protein VG895_05320 [Patescibacteria group bacterium]|nr:hypothetical protein [Patescibacteria group bacterium]